MRTNGKKIVLVAIELEGWERTLEVAKELATALGAEIVLCHVVHMLVAVYPDLPATLFAELSQEVEEASRKQLERIAAGAGNLRTVLMRGEPASGILAAIDEQKPALVVLGTHGRRGIGRLLLGSVAERVLRQSSVPVVTVPPGDKGGR